MPSKKLVPAMQGTLIAASRAEAIGPVGRLKVELADAEGRPERAGRSERRGVRRPRAGPTL